MEKQNEITELKRFIDCLEVKDPIGHRNLTLAPIGGSGV